MINPPPLRAPNTLPTRRQASWQRPRWSAAFRRALRIGCGSVLLLGLCTLLGFALLAPFAQPQVHVCVLTGVVPISVQPDSLTSLRPSPGASAVLPLVRSWTEAAQLPAPQSIEGLSTGRTIDELRQFVQSSQIVRGDVVIAVVQSQMVTIDGTVYLVDRLHPSDPQRGRLPLESVIDAFRASSARTKLLCLDAGQLSADPRCGIGHNHFGEPLRRMVEHKGDPGLWVLVSHLPGQCSQRCRGGVATEFVEAVVRGLHCEANLNQDDCISLDELVRFVQSAMIESDSSLLATTTKQTPWLLRGQKHWSPAELDVVLAPVPQSLRRHAATATTVPPQSTTVTAESAASPGAGGASPSAESRSDDASSGGPDGKPPSLAAEGGDAGLPADRSALDTVNTDRGTEPALAKPVSLMTVPELLNACWVWRDRLESGHRSDNSMQLLAPSAYAPWRWNRMESELIQAEALWQSQPDAFPSPILRLLQRRLNDLQALAGVPAAVPSPWCDELLQLRPQLPGGIGPALSLAFAEQWQRWNGTAVSDVDAAERTTIQELLAATDSQPLLKWKETPRKPVHSELQLVTQLLANEQLDWLLIQQALRVRTLAETLACDPVAVRWLTADVRRADQLRWYGERKLSDPIRAEDGPLAQQALREAEALYLQVAKSAEQLAEAEQLEWNLLADVPHWMALSRHRELDIHEPFSSELILLITDLEELIERLANANPDERGRIEQLREGLVRRQQRIEALLSVDSLIGQWGRAAPATRAQRQLVESLLQTPLLTGPQRSQLQAWLATSVRPPMVVSAMAASPKRVSPQEISVSPTAGVEPLGNSGTRTEQSNAGTIRGKSTVETILGKNHPSVVVQSQDELERRYSRLLQPLQWHAETSTSGSGRWRFPPAEVTLPRSSHLSADNVSAAKPLRSRTAQFAEAQIQDRGLNMSVSEAILHRPAGAAPISTLADNWYRHVALPGQLREHLEAQSLDSVASADAIEAWRHTFLLVDSRDDMTVELERRLSARFVANVQRVIRWQRQQALMSQADASESETARLQSQINALNALLGKGIVEVPAAESLGSLRVTGSDVVDLVTASEQTVLLTVLNAGRSPTPVRYVVEYDPAFLQVTTNCPHCQLGPHASSLDSQFWPYRTADGPQLTTTLPVDRQDELRLHLRGQPAERPARLVVHVVSDRTSVRRDITVNLPRQPLAAVRVMSTSNAGLVVTNGQLRPMGNRATSYSLALESVSSESRTLDVTAYRVSSPRFSLPSASTLPTSDFHSWLAQTGEMHEIATVTGVVVKPGSQVPVRFPALKPEPNVMWDLCGGILVVMHDAAKSFSTWQHLQCVPLRPQAYLDAHVEYNASQEQLQIAVRSRDEWERPADGVTIRCRIVQLQEARPETAVKWESAAAHAVTGTLMPDQREFSLQLPWRNASEPALVLVDVDGWPRAFAFKVGPDGARPAEDFVAEVLSPVRRSAIRAPVDQIPVTVALSFPARLLLGEMVAEVGIDRNGDRRLDGEPTYRLPADRQTQVRLEAIDATGTWTVRSTVGDWQVMIPAAGLSDQWGTVLARIACGPHETWSDGVAVAFDKAGPQLSRVQVSDDGEPTVGQPLRITARVEDHGLSGVASVSAAIDPTGLGILSPQTVLVPGKADGADNWDVTLPTDKLLPGPYVVILQASDLVGNTGPVLAIPIRCLTADEAAAKAAARNGTLSGQVQYGGMPVGDADVRLVRTVSSDSATGAAGTTATKVSSSGGAGSAAATDSASALASTTGSHSGTTRPLTAKNFACKTDRSGQFSFEAVPSGKYELIVIATIRGFRYESRSELVVGPTTAFTPVQIVLGQKPR
jgi:hypothetical protein